MVRMDSRLSRVMRIADPERPNQIVDGLHNRKIVMTWDTEKYFSSVPPSPDRGALT